MTVQIKFSRGIVVAIKANYLLVDLEVKNKDLENKQTFFKEVRLLCKMRSRLSYKENHVFVGDNVLLEEINLDYKTGIICDILPRKSLMDRPPVANISDIYVVISLVLPEFDFDQTSRFLLAAENTGQNVNIILTKSDLIDIFQTNKYIHRLNSWGYKAFPVSVKNGYGMDDLISELNNISIGVLCGPSGSGKSSLINYLLPKAGIPVRDLTKKLNRGRHTTRHVELFALGKKSLLADTPGFNRPEIIVNSKELALLFPELKSQLSNKHCKFRDCLHLDEPGCLVDKNWERYSNYRNLLESMISSPR
ncbi:MULTISPECIES: ribosome small subunit-dependent GTPase A [Prochlorococcus]|uniref:ribosome small subunit-dependent GTPase A n=1 Tax=Prochlorococcus TaxID=1218 RepID=UPI000533A2D3|nr:MULTISPECIES: ribosome small subunit-dependent GTPase A [Prochlorococcus]KGG13373.1 Ribosome small subunit-stimulated GTPase EngC [Prochlorococcus sp. MIT 0601]